MMGIVHSKAIGQSLAPRSSLLAPRAFKSSLSPRSSLLAPRAFTLVELLVVITIIGILAALITVAAVGALKTAQRTRIKAEVNQIAGGVDESKNKTTAYPPNCQTDDKDFTTRSMPIDEPTVLNDLKRYMKQAFQLHQESDDLLFALIGQTGSGTVKNPLAGGMAADEALVFWLGGFSADPKFPISGEGGPSYPITKIGDPNNRTLDPIESRKWIYPFDVSRLGPRDTSGYFDEVGSGNRFIEYTVTIRGQTQNRRINFWHYTPAHSEQPYLYFDTSRHAPGPPVSTTSNRLLGYYDPPASTTSSPLNGVYAFKKVSDSASASVPIQFINPAKYQVIHCGINGTWDTDNFARMSPEAIPAPAKHSINPSDYLLFPDGPFVGDIGDTIVSFTTETRLEDAAK